MGSRVRAPALIIHGKKDRLVPVEHGVELYRLCCSRKLLVCPADMEHNCNLLKNVSYFIVPMLQFFPLPDYSFEEIHMPSWAYRMPQEAGYLVNVKVSQEAEPVGDDDERMPMVEANGDYHDLGESMATPRKSGISRGPSTSIRSLRL